MHCQCWSFLACKKHDSLIKEMLSRYDNLEYVDSDSFRLSHTVNEMFTGLLSEKGFQRKDDTQYIDGWVILSSDYFNPLYGMGGYHIKKIPIAFISILRHGGIRKKNIKII